MEVFMLALCALLPGLSLGEDYIPQCGRRNRNGVTRIQGFNGQLNAQFGEWPHMCIVLEVGFSGSLFYQCGGSLISPGTVLTAAHCVEKFRQNPEKLKIRCGEWDTTGDSESLAHQDRVVQTVYTHPEFSANNDQYINDFGVLFLSEDFELGINIDTACLPEENKVLDQETCFVAGWGKNITGSLGSYQVVLKGVELPMVNHHSCQEKIRSKLGKHFELDESSICAGGLNSKGSCTGDDGGPLVCSSKSDPDIYVQTGIVSWRVSCGEDGTPGVYSAVHKAVCWIKNLISCHTESDVNDECATKSGMECKESSPCKTQFKRNTVLTGKRIQGTRGKTRTIQKCWEKCKRNRKCSYINWVRQHQSVQQKNMCTLMAIKGKGKKKKGVISGRGC